MITTSEFVSLGHPDKTADYISSYLLDRYLEQDPYTRYAVEVQIKDNFVTLGGEVTSKAKFSDEDIKKFVRDAVAEVGYTAEYAAKWGDENALNCDNLDVVSHIGSQSPDIAQGVDADGWGDQGIFHGMATPDEQYGFMPKDHFLASQLGRFLYAGAAENGYGIDIKTQVERTDDKESQVIVAIPTKKNIDNNSFIYNKVYTKLLDCSCDKDKIIINGTGAYVRHSSWGDCGTTGRKLAVDFYGGGCKIGGGSPWTKDGTKADVALNLYARKLALTAMRMTGKTVFCSIASCIGKKDISIQMWNEWNEPLNHWVESRPAESIIRELDLRSPRFAKMCRLGLFHNL